MRYALPLALLFVVAALLSASRCVAAEYYTVVGAGARALGVGTPADRLNFDESPIGVAAAPDGTFAFSAEGRIAWVRDGRVIRVSRRVGETDMAFEPNGSLLVTSGDVLWRFGRSGGRTRVAGRPDVSRDSGDGGLAGRATFRCASGIDVDASGAILVADKCARRVRRISPDGLITTVAGNGQNGRGGDGSPATQAPLRAPDDVVALPRRGIRDPRCSLQRLRR
jgi:hypothetical protein